MAAAAIAPASTGPHSRYGIRVVVTAAAAGTIVDVAMGNSNLRA
jgi:hypothetical protein